MKKAMSGFDLRVIARELDALKGAYVKKAYMPHYEQIVLRVNPKEMEQRDIVFVRGARIYTSQRDRPMPMTPPAVCYGASKTPTKRSPHGRQTGWI